MANNKFTNALSRVPQATPPIWCMRQAGRYHKHYQKLKETYSFVQLCKEPELAAETAMGPIEDFDFDVAILFSDLLFPLEALGLGLEYNPGPQLDRSLDDKNILQLRPLDEAIGHLEFQKLAMQATRERLPKDKSLIGFVGGPWTLFGYAVEGKHQGNMQLAKSRLSLFPRFCEIMVPLLIKNIQLQLDGGAEVVMVLDTAVGELSPDVFNSLVAPELNKLAAAYPQKLGYYSKGTQAAHLTTQMWTTKNWGGFGYDHRWPLTEVFSKGHGLIQGNFDQSLLFCPTEDFRQHVKQFIMPIQAMSVEERAGWVCGLGHGILPKTPENHVRLFVEMLREAFA